MYPASVWLHHVDVCSNVNVSSNFTLFMFKVQWLKQNLKFSGTSLPLSLLMSQENMKHQFHSLASLLYSLFFFSRSSILSFHNSFSRGLILFRSFLECLMIQPSPLPPREKLAIKGKFSVTLSIGCHMKKRKVFPPSARCVLWIKIAETILLRNIVQVLKFTS